MCRSTLITQKGGLISSPHRQFRSFLPCLTISNINSFLLKLIGRISSASSEFGQLFAHPVGDRGLDDVASYWQNEKATEPCTNVWGVSQWCSCAPGFLWSLPSRSRDFGWLEDSMAGIKGRRAVGQHGSFGTPAATRNLESDQFISTLMGLAIQEDNFVWRMLLWMLLNLTYAGCFGLLYVCTHNLKHNVIFNSNAVDSSALSRWAPTEKMPCCWRVTFLMWLDVRLRLVAPNLVGTSKEFHISLDLKKSSME